MNERLIERSLEALGERIERKLDALSERVESFASLAHERDAEEGGARPVAAAPVLSKGLTPQEIEISDLGGGGIRLLHPLSVTVDVQGATVLVSDDHVNMYGSGATLDQALVDYRDSLVEYLTWLQANEGTLAAHLREHLEWLRRRVRLEERA